MSRKRKIVAAGTKLAIVQLYEKKTPKAHWDS